MLSYHIVLNGSSSDFTRQANELNGFIQRNGIGQLNPGKTFIICDKELDEDGKMHLASFAPTKSVYFIIQDYYEPEGVLNALISAVKKDDLYLFGSNYSGWELAIRLGQRAGGSSIQGCMTLSCDQNRILASKMAYSNHMKATWQLIKSPYCVSISKGQDEGVCLVNNHQIVQQIDLSSEPQKAAIRKCFQPYQETDGLTKAPFVMVVGRGIKRKEVAIELLNQAKKMGAAFGASRPVVMNAWIPMENLVGVSGAMIKPELCIVVGASGASALYAGIEKSKFIVAINSDECAPMMKKADVVIVGDGQEVIDELTLIIERGMRWKNN